MSKTSEFRASMSGDEFVIALEKLGLSQPQYAALTGLNLSTINRRVSGKSEINSEGAILLRLLLEKPDLLPLAWEASGLAEAAPHKKSGWQRLERDKTAD